MVQWQPRCLSSPYLSQTVVEHLRVAAVRAGRAGGVGAHRPGDKDQSEECVECVHGGVLTFTHHPASLACPEISLTFLIAQIL